MLKNNILKFFNFQLRLLFAHCSKKTLYMAIYGIHH